MMKAQDIYRVNAPRVIFENIDGELILVHMEKGAYYTTDEVGALLWDLIEGRATTAEMVTVLHTEYDVTRADAEAALAAFLERLSGEDLVSLEDPGVERTAPRRAPVNARRPFRAPVLESFRDMQDMLALDPIHDVEAVGWPVPKADDDSITSQSA
jgi:hypothetical protein